MKKAIIEVTQRIEVTIDETKFDAEFFEQFNESITDYGDDLNEHVRHLAVLYTRGFADDHMFIEGYGPAKEMGIKFNVIEEYDTIEQDVG